MTRKINIVVYAILLIFIFSLAYAPDEITEQPKEKSPVELRLMIIEKKIDELITGKDSMSKKLDDLEQHLNKIEQLIRSRVK